MQNLKVRLVPRDITGLSQEYVLEWLSFEPVVQQQS